MKKQNKCYTNIFSSWKLAITRKTQLQTFLIAGLNCSQNNPNVKATDRNISNILQSQTIKLLCLVQITLLVL